jgi:hemolysin activation/secretion protein
MMKALWNIRQVRLAVALALGAGALCAQAQEAQPMPGTKPNVPPVQAPPPVPPPDVTPPIEVQGASPAGPVHITDNQAPASQFSMAVETIAFTGNRVVPASTLAEIARPYVGRSLEPSEVETLRNELTHHYLQHGYLNSGSMPPRYDAATHTLTFPIVEGQLTSVQAHGLERLAPSYLEARLLGGPNEVLNLDRIRERFQALLADPLISRANARVLPGAAPGEAVLDVDVERARPYGATLFANNYRPPSIGEFQAGLSSWVRNLSGHGDLLDFGYQRHPGGGKGDALSADWHLPFDAGRGEGYVAADKGASSVVDAALLRLGIRSESRSVSAGARETVFQQGQNLAATLGGDVLHRSSQTWLLGQKFSFTQGSQDGFVSERGLRLWGEMTYRSERQVAVGRLTYSRMGNDLVEQAGAPAVVNAIPTSVQYWIAQGQYSRVLLEDGTTVGVRATLQQASQHLPSLDQMSVGGLGTVRGFVENDYVRDIGRVLNLSVDHPFSGFRGALSGTIGPFLDWGQSKNVGDQATNLSSAGFSFKAVWAGLKFDLTYGKRISHPSGTVTSGGLQEHGVELQVSYDLFARLPAGGR